MIEAYAGLQAVKLGSSMGLNKMGVVGDLKTIIKRCQKNVYAHVIAKEALKRRESFYLMGGIPESVCHALEKLQPKLPD
ncbi:hypothetical protein Gotri_024998 [Gossypium trilobum]|uniref:RNase H type-1 domain-containing protein n=1 Tax=Gossypium trilobum TaxID=34281 RepID=A0A7J9FSB0_9ROSI|nr:hypothetical protein [Gossypium trilobum]